MTTSARDILLSGCLLGVVAISSSAGCNAIVGADADPTIAAPAPLTKGCVGTSYVRIASDFSGTATDIAIPYFFGMYDYLREINAKGGVKGCQVDVGVSDNNYTPAGTQTNVDAWTSGDPHWAAVNTVFVFGTGPTKAVAAGLWTGGKIVVPGSYAGALESPTAIDHTVSYPVMNEQFQMATQSEEKKSPGYPNVFFPATDYGTGIRLAIQAVWQTAPGRLAMAHDTVDACAYCNDPLAAGKSFVGSLQGMSLGRDLTIPQTSNMADAAKIDATVQAYFQAEVAHVLADPTYQPVSWVWSGNSVMATSLLGQSLWNAQQTLINGNTQLPEALRKSWKLRVIANNWGIGETTPTICGAACNNDNFYGLFPVARYGDLTRPGMGDLVALHDKYAALDTSGSGPIPPRTVEQYRDVRYVQGYVAAVMWEKAMLAAIEAGSKNPTGAELKAALEKFASVDFDGLTAVPISFSPTDHRPQSAESIYKLDAGGKFVFVDNYNINATADWLGW